MGLAAMLTSMSSGEAHGTEAGLLAQLGEAPLCEASAVARAPWDPGQVLVADNEISDALFSFRLVDGRLLYPQVIPMPRKRRPLDIEALATVGQELLVVGSFGRDGGCKAKKKTRRLRRLRWDADGWLESGSAQLSPEHWNRLSGSEAACIAALLEGPASEEGAAFCRAIVEAEQNASETDCRVLDIEGAATVTADVGSGANRVWLGMRTPLVEGKAVLARLAPGLDALRFDRIRLVPLDGFGLRALDYQDGRIWGLASGAPDLDGDSVLWSIDASSLETSSPPHPTIHRSDLPQSAEGLLLAGDQALFVLDGAAAGRHDSECRLPARQGLSRVGVVKQGVSRPPAAVTH